MKKKVSFKEAARIILQKVEEPISAKEITAIALEQGLLETEGRTPEATMAAQLYVDINRNPNSSFQKVGKGLFTLKKKKGKLDSPVVFLEEQNERVRKVLKDRLHAIDPYQFEFLVADLLQNIGFENVEVTKRSGDNGIDILANLTVGGVTDVKTVVQVKRYKEGNKISGSVIRELRGTAEVDQRGLVITTSDFQKNAREEAKAPNKMPVSLINGTKLIELLVRYEVGVRKTPATILSIDQEYFENEPELGAPSGGDVGKNRSLWPLPGGITRYVDTLNELLQAVNEGTTTRDKLITWLINQYENVSSQKTAYGYTNVPKNMGLLVINDGKFSLTERGAEYLESLDTELLYSIIADNILAFDDILEYIVTTGSPQKEESILEFVSENFDVNWKTFAQVNYRLVWLMNLGKLEKTKEGYISV